MMLSYKKTKEEEKEYSNIPKQLSSQDRGGLRIITEKYLKIITPWIMTIQELLPNIILVNNGDFRTLLKKIDTDTNKKQFILSFDVKIFDEILNNEKNEKFKQETNDILWKELIYKNTESVYYDLQLSLCRKGVWGFIKDKGNGLDKTSLRQKLSLLYNTTKQAKLPINAT